MMKKMGLLVLMASLSISHMGCGDDSEGGGTAFGAPSLAAIVDSAAPTSLKSATALQFMTLACSGSTSTGCGNASEYLSFLQAGVFKVSTEANTAASQYYRYWVDKVDEAMAETNTRLKGSEAPCLTQAAVAVDYTFNINATNVTVTTKLQCWEKQTAPGTKTQDMAFGKDDTHFYLVYRTNDNATTGGSGVRIVIAKASADGNEADIWFVGTSYQTVPNTTTVELRGNAQRVLANKATKAFTFNSVEEDDTAKGMVFGNFFGNTDGTNLYMEAAYGNGTAVTDVTGMTRAAPYCAALSAIGTALSASVCADIDADSLPTAFGLTRPMTNSSTGGAVLWQADATAEAAYETAIDAIGDIDYTAKGVGLMPGS